MSSDSLVKSSRMLKTKKFLASKVADSKLGRKTIMAVLGDEGEIIFQSLKNVIKHISGQEKGKEIKRDILKMTLKAKIMFDQGQLTKSSTMFAEGPLEFFGQKLIDVLSGEVRDDSVRDLSSTVSRIRHIINQLMSSFLTEGNAKLLDDLLLYFGSKTFLHGFIYDEALMLERTTILKMLQQMYNRAGL